MDTSNASSQIIVDTYSKPLAWPTEEAGPGIISRLKNHDKSAIKDCLNTYGGRIWSLARKFTSSYEDAQIVTEEIFEDIWKYAASDTDAETEDPVEERIITKLAIRRLLKHEWKGREIF